MIFVDRSVMDPPAVLVGDGSDGMTEFAAWQTYFEKIDAGEEAEEPADFSAYKKVRAELEELFHRKCAYCETRVKAISHGDIEHWRPKKAVRLADGTRRSRGYWWRAAAWDNLLLSCPLCNQPPGKGIKFPVADEARRATGPADEGEEQPLLLDPTVDDPVRYLELAETGERRALLLAIDPPGGDPKGEASIDVFRLNRADLVIERRERLIDLVDLIADVRDILQDLDELAPGSPRIAEKEQRLVSKLARLKGLLEPDQEYLLLARQVAEPFIDEIGAG